MAKLTIYLPDDLAEAVRDSDISPSPRCQEALAREVKKLQATKEATSDIEKVAARLAATRSDADAEEHKAGHNFGVRWARDDADFRDLESLSALDQTYWTSIHIEAFPSLESWMETLDDEDLPQGVSSLAHLRHLPPREPFFLGFVAGALEVFDAVQAHL
jgi:post-segregation antitoxin (ccd killing protein)